MVPLKMISRLMLLLTAVQLAASNEYLLPKDVVPTHYDVRLLYNVDHAKNFPFYGVVDIQLLIKQATSKIVFHASEEYTIANDNIKLVGQNVSPRVSVVGLNPTYDLFTLQTDQELKAGENYSLVIPFFGNLKFGLSGVYISSYVHKVTSTKEYVIATQFGPTSAREGFPCFDEPIYKATFKITIGHNKYYTAVSNMPLDSSTGDNALEPQWSWDVIEQKFNKPSSDFVWDEFQNSLPMSTYLVAFVVSKFQYVDSPPALSKAKFRIWARSDAIDQTAYAATLGPKVLSFYEDWFNVSFPLPKLDMVAIPDFSAGAMENWGLVTYRESSLLFDKEQSSSLNKERVAEVIAHELAHQWFGNLVTMNWWSDLWLKEGFACFVAYLGVSALEPTWKAGINYAADDILSVLVVDALESSHPVSLSNDNSIQISELLDQISYLKGSILIRMMSKFLGESVFKKGLHNYLTKYSYRNAEQDDLWAELTEVNKQYGGFSRNVNVKEVMDTWTTQTGYPLLTVNRDYRDGSFTIRQKRYMSRELSTSTETSWWVPLQILSENEVGQSQTSLKWLAPNEGVSAPYRLEHGANSNQWVLFNSDMIAPYRVNYDERNWALLSRVLASDSYTDIPVLGRVQLLTDAFELAWTNILDYSTALQLAKYLHHETEFLPLWTALNALGKIQIVLKRTPDYGVFQKFMRLVIGEMYSKAGGLATKMILNKDNPDRVKMQDRHDAYDYVHQRGIVTVHKSTAAAVAAYTTLSWVRLLFHHYGNMADVERATSETSTSEEWGLILEICDRASSSPAAARDCLRAVLRRLAHHDPHVQLAAITLLDAAAANVGRAFRLEVASRDFETEFRRLLARAQPPVATRMRALLKKWAEGDFRDDPQLDLIPSLHAKLRAEAGEPPAAAAPPAPPAAAVAAQREQEELERAIALSLRDAPLYPRVEADPSPAAPAPAPGPAPAAAPRKVRALYDFEAAEDNELTFLAGELVHVTDSSDPNWWKGHNERGEGLFPANFVTTDLAEPAPESAARGAAAGPAGAGPGPGGAGPPEELVIDEAAMDACLAALLEADPAADGAGGAGGAGEARVLAMGPLVDAALERADRRHARLTQLSAELVDALNLYHELMRDAPRPHPHPLPHPHPHHPHPPPPPAGYQLR